MDMPPILPEWWAAWADAVWGAVGTLICAFGGRMLWHVRQVQKRHRRFWSVHLIWETITAVCIWWFADGVADYFEFQGKGANAVIVAISYMGPAGLEAVLLRIADRYASRRT